MNRLALETSTLRAAVALERADGARFGRLGDPGRRHGRELLPTIRDLLAEAGLRAADLGAIGVGLGPGSYTGLRVGVTAAKTLAYATGAVAVGLDSPAWFARSAPAEALRIAVLSDAQRGDFHVAEFGRPAVGAAPSRLGPTTIESPAELRDRWAGPLAVVGPGVARWAGDWPPGVTASGDVEPDPSWLLDVLGEALASGRRDDLWALEPIYLRRSAAEDQWERRPS